MKTYYGDWSAGQSYNAEPYEFTSKAEAITTMRAIAKGNNTGSGCSFTVTDSDGNDVAHDLYDGRGRKYSQQLRRKDETDKKNKKGALVHVEKEKSPCGLP